MVTFLHTFSHDCKYGPVCVWGSMPISSSYTLSLSTCTTRVIHRPTPNPARLARYSYLYSNQSPPLPISLVFFYKTPVLTAGWIGEAREDWIFIEDQAFFLSYVWFGSTPATFPLSPVNKLFLFLSLSVCRQSSESYNRKEAWASINRSILYVRGSG